MTGISEDLKPRHRLKWWHIVVSVLALCILVLIAIRFKDRTNLTERLDAIRAAGYPVTFAELDAWYEDVPYGENAADYVLDAIACLQKPQREQERQIPWMGNAEKPARTQALDAEIVDTIGELLERNHEAIGLLQKAGALRRSRYPIDLTKGHGTLLPHLSDLRGTVRLLCLKAVLHAERGEQEPAADALVSAFGVANSEASTPLLLCQMVRQGGQSIALSALERVVNRTTLGEEHLTRLREAVAAAYDPNAMARGFVGERCMVIQALRDPRSTGLGLAPVVATEGPSYLQLRAAQAVGLVDRLLVQYIDYVDRLLAALRLPPPKRPEAVGELERRHQDMQEAHPTLTWIMPPLARVFRNDLAHITKLQVAAVALAVERYRQTNDRLPEQLADLVPGFLQTIPLDPYDAEPL
ncbi:MAG: hypothetical protein ACYTAS_16965, partial [Planctomycetota bacterium]